MGYYTSYNPSYPLNIVSTPQLLRLKINQWVELICVSGENLLCYSSSLFAHTAHPSQPHRPMWWGCINKSITKL